MELSADRLASQVAKEPLRPAYLIAGNEPLLVLEAADAVRAAARAQGIGEREMLVVELRRDMAAAILRRVDAASKPGASAQ